MEEKIYDTAWELFSDLKSLKTEITSITDPKRLLIGWGSKKYMRVAYLRIFSIRSRKALVIPYDFEQKKQIQDKLTELIVDEDGRRQIAKYLSYEIFIPEFEALDRIMDLKAFW